MKDKIFATVLSIGISGSLFSGIDSLQSMGFAVVFVFNVLAWIAFLFIPSMKLDGLRNVVSTPIITWMTTALQWAALLYSGHPYLAGSSLVVCSLIWMSATRRIKESTQ